MLTITIPATELFDDSVGTHGAFLPKIEETTLMLEHSLVSLSKWEQKWKIPFLSNKSPTTEQTIDYIRCMCLTPEVSPEVYNAIPNEAIQQVNDYISDTMTATWFNESPGQKSSSEVVTAEVIYYWLVALTIPFETQEWHLNRLLTLIRVTNLKNDPKKKLMPLAEQQTQQRDINAERRAKMGTKG